MAKKTKGKQKTDEKPTGNNVGSNAAPAPEPNVLSATVTEIDFRPEPPMERQATGWGADSGGWGMQEAQPAGDTWGTARHESEEAWGDHPESLLQPPPPPQSHGILPTIPEHSSPGGQSSQIRRSLSDIGESQQSRDDYDSWGGQQDSQVHHYAEGQQSQTLTATAAPSAMGSPAPPPAISLTEAVSRAHAQSLVGQKVSSASEAARKLEESRGRLNTYPTNTNTISVGVSPAVHYEPLKDHSNHAQGGRTSMSSASVAAALLESTSNRLRAQGRGTSKPPQPTVIAPPGKTTWTYPKPVVPNGRPAATIPPDASWTMTGGNTWSNKHRQTKSSTVHWGQGNENVWSQQMSQYGQPHQHQQHQHPQHQHSQHPQASHQTHQRPQHHKHNSHPGHPTHQQRPPHPGQSQSWQGWGKDRWDQEELSETETEETAEGWPQHGGDGWPQGGGGGGSWDQRAGGWNQQQQQQQQQQQHHQGRGGGNPDRGRGRGAKHPDDGRGQQGGWDQGEAGGWGQSNDGWSQTRGHGQGRGQGQGQGQGRGHAPSDNGWGNDDGDGWRQQQDSGWGKTADGGWSKTADGGWGKEADAGWGKSADAGWGKDADAGWGENADASWGAGGEWGGGEHAPSNSEWGAGQQSKEAATSRPQVSEQQKAQIMNSMLPQGQNQKNPSNLTTAQLQAAQLQAQLTALQNAIAQGQKGGMTTMQLQIAQQHATQTRAQLAMVLNAMGQNQKNENMTTAQHQAAQIHAAQLQARLAAAQGAKLPPKAKPQENKDVWEAYGDDDGWGSVDSSDDEYDPSRRVHFSPKASDLWGGSPRSVPSKTLLQAQQQQGIGTTPLNLTSNVRFVESRGAAFAFVSNAFFGNSRFARERIHWMFPANKDERVANMLAWVQKMSFNLATFGLIKFLESRERGALFVNAVFRMHQHPNEPAFDWLTFNELQGTMDKTLQESTAFYDPARLVTVFVYLPSQSGNSVAIWRRKINVPDSARLKYQAEINAVTRNLRPEKDYVVMVDELPKAKPKTPQKGQLRKSVKALPAKKSKSPSKDAQKAQKKRKWWKFFLS